MQADNILDRLISEYGDTILRTCYLYLKDYHLAEDAAQETFIKAMKHYGGFRHRSSEKTWLTRIAINCCKNMMRTRWYSQEREELADADAADLADPIGELIEKSCISQGIMELEPDDREILILFYYQELKLKEIASVIGRVEMKHKIRSAADNKHKQKRKMMKPAAAAAALVIFGGTCVYAGYSLLNVAHVNDKELPALDPMKKVTAGEIPRSYDESGQIFQEYSPYDEVNELLDGILLDSPLAEENPYMQVAIQTDNQDFGIITAENYILGDTHGYQLVPDAGRYNCEPGKVYASSVSLEAAYMLSSEQEAAGWNNDYLGYYKYAGSYVSEEGYKVNLIRSTAAPAVQESRPEICAVFVADGIQYTLKGRVPEDTMKEIVDSMEKIAD